MLFNYSNNTVEKEVSDELGVEQSLVKKIFEHQCSYTKRLMQTETKFVRWMYIGAFMFNEKHKKKYEEIIKNKPNTK